VFCLRNISVDILHKVNTDDDDDDNNDDNNNNTRNNNYNNNNSNIVDIDNNYPSLEVLLGNPFLSDDSKILIFAELGQLSFHIVDENINVIVINELAINIKI